MMVTWLRSVNRHKELQTLDQAEMSPVAGDERDFFEKCGCGDQDILFSRISLRNSVSDFRLDCLRTART